MEKPRQIAARLLLAQGQTTGFIEDQLDSLPALAGLSRVDRALCQELVYGVIRWRRALDWMIARKTPGRAQSPAAQVILRLGLYQMFWLDRIPNHAAVHETVELTRSLGIGAKSGFVNAILRAYAREREQTVGELARLRGSDPAAAYSHPDWLVARWQERWKPEEVQALLEWNNSPPPTLARVNRLRSEPDALAEAWKAEGVEAIRRDYSWAGAGTVFELRGHPPLASLPSFREGRFYVQDPSTLLAVHELDPQPGERVLDMCAAPGGKAGLMAELMRNEGRIVARDIFPDRLDLLRENIARLGLGNVDVELAGDENRAGEARFDRVLLDAPCSNSGVLRRRVDLRWRIRPEEINRLQETQKKLLRRGLMSVRPGGVLVYSTCSLEPEENRAVVETVLREIPGVVLDKESSLVPFRDGVDGAYVARLVRRE